MTSNYCVFCDKANPDKHEIVAENDLAYAGKDPNPVSKGHTLISPYRHVESFFDLTEKEVQAVFDLSKQVRNKVSADFGANNFNLGINDGPLAGRTINHMHLHIIPRYKGDVANPRGGIRHVIPKKGNY